LLPWGHPCPKPKPHLDQFSGYCRAHDRDRQIDEPRYNSVCNNIDRRYSVVLRCGLVMIKQRETDAWFVGPQYWPEIAPAAGGRRQSPIMIRSCQATFCQTLRERPLIISYDEQSANKLTNNGHTVQLTVDGTRSSASFSTSQLLLCSFHMANSHV